MEPHLHLEEQCLPSVNCPLPYLLERDWQPKCQMYLKPIAAIAIVNGSVISGVDIHSDILGLEMDMLMTYNQPTNYMCVYPV